MFVLETSFFCIAMLYKRIAVCMHISFVMFRCKSCQPSHSETQLCCKISFTVSQLPAFEKRHASTMRWDSAFPKYVGASLLPVPWVSPPPWNSPHERVHGNALSAVFGFAHPLLVLLATNAQESELTSLFFALWCCLQCCVVVGNGFSPVNRNLPWALWSSFHDHLVFRILPTQRHCRFFHQDESFEQNSFNLMVASTFSAWVCLLFSFLVAAASAIELETQTQRSRHGRWALERNSWLGHCFVSPCKVKHKGTSPDTLVRCSCICFTPCSVSGTRADLCMLPHSQGTTTGK